MKLWIKLFERHKVAGETVLENSLRRPDTAEEWVSVLSEALKPLDTSCPVLMNCHVRDFDMFSRASFLPSDFMENVPFERMEAEILREKKPDGTYKDL